MKLNEFLKMTKKFQSKSGFFESKQNLTSEQDQEPLKGTMSFRCFVEKGHNLTYEQAIELLDIYASQTGIIDMSIRADYDNYDIGSPDSCSEQLINLIEKVQIKLGKFSKF